MKKINIKLKVSVIFLILSIIATIYSANVYADSDSSQVLDNVEYDIQINSDGSMDVKELWDIDIEYTNTLFKKFNKDTSKYTEMTNGKVSIIENGVTIPMTNYGQYAYHVPTNQYYFIQDDSSYEIAWGTGLENSTGNKKYLIEYHVTGAVAKYSDVAELYWQVFGDNFNIPIRKLTGTIKLPSEVQNKNDIYVWGHAKELNGEIHATSNDTISFEVLNNKRKRMVEIRVAFPSSSLISSDRTYNTNKLSSIINEETKWANDANSQRMRSLGIVYGVSGIIAVLMIYVIIRNILFAKSIVKIVPTQRIEYFREIPRADATPAEARFIIDKSSDSLVQQSIGKIFMATILDLSLKNVLKIEQVTDEKGKEDSRITLIGYDESAIKEDELRIIKFLKNAITSNGTNGNSITLKELKKYINKNSESIVLLKSCIDESVKHNLLNKNILSKEAIQQRKSMKYNTLPYIVFMLGIVVTCFVPDTINYMLDKSWIAVTIGVVSFVLAVISAIIAQNKINTYTQSGVDEMEKWKAFRKYMTDFSLLKERDIPDLVIWEQYLVYATAFGISEKVIEQLKMVYPTYNDSNFAYNYSTMYILMNTDFNSSFNSIGTSMNSSFSSGSGGGGGFSGGGGGGRWPEVVEEEDNL